MLTRYERDYTISNYQVSLSIKSIFFQLINSIVLPLVVNYYIKRNARNPNYEELYFDILILSITNSLMSPLLKVLDLYYFAFSLYQKYKLQPCTSSLILEQKLSLNQYELNSIVEKMEFELGYEYIYIINLYLFTCFFASLQPLVCVFAVIGLFSMHWAQKYSLFKRCQRTVPGSQTLNTAMSQLIYSGPLLYTIGNLAWSYFLLPPTPTTSAFQVIFLPNILCVGLSIGVMLIPYETIFRRIIKKHRMPKLSYEESRIYFTTEYDRMNPSTSESGIKEYIQYLEKRREELAE